MSPGVFSSPVGFSDYRRPEVRMVGADRFAGGDLRAPRRRAA